MTQVLVPQTALRTTDDRLPGVFRAVCSSEWTKLRTVRSTYWALIVAALLGIGLGALISAISANHYATDPSLRFNWNPTDRSLRSLEIAQLAFAILGVMVVTGEYSTGMMTKKPRRNMRTRPLCASRWRPFVSAPSETVRVVAASARVNA